MMLLNRLREKICSRVGETSRTCFIASIVCVLFLLAVGYLAVLPYFKLEYGGSDHQGCELEPNLKGFLYVSGCMQALAVLGLICTGRHGVVFFIALYLGNVLVLVYGTFQLIQVAPVVYSSDHCAESVFSQVTPNATINSSPGVTVTVSTISSTPKDVLNTIKGLPNPQVPDPRANTNSPIFNTVGNLSNISQDVLTVRIPNDQVPSQNDATNATTFGSIRNLGNAYRGVLNTTVGLPNNQVPDHNDSTNTATFDSITNLSNVHRGISNTTMGLPNTLDLDLNRTATRNSTSLSNNTAKVTSSYTTWIAGSTRNNSGTIQLSVVKPTETKCVTCSRKLVDLALACVIIEWVLYVALVGVLFFPYGGSCKSKCCTQCGHKSVPGGSTHRFQALTTVTSEV